MKLISIKYKDEVKINKQNYGNSDIFPTICRCITVAARTVSQAQKSISCESSELSVHLYSRWSDTQWQRGCKKPKKTQGE